MREADIFKGVEEPAETGTVFVEGVDERHGWRHRGRIIDDFRYSENCASYRYADDG